MVRNNKFAWDETMLDEARKLRASGMGYKELAVHYNMTLSTIFNYINMGLPYERYYETYYKKTRRAIVLHACGVSFFDISNQLHVSETAIKKRIKKYKREHPNEMRELLKQCNGFICQDCKFCKDANNQGYYKCFKNVRQYRIKVKDAACKEIEVAW